MATVKLSLSRKCRQDTKEHEIYLRLSVDRTHVLRAKTGLFIGTKSWSQSSQRVIISRMKTVDNAKLTALQGEIDKIVNDIVSAAVTTPIEHIDKGWLQAIIMKSRGIEATAIVPKPIGEATADSKNSAFINAMEHFIQVQCKTARRRDHFHCMERMVKRFSIYAGFSLHLDSFTADHLRQFEKFLIEEHTFFDEKGNCIKHQNVYKQEPCKRIPLERGLNAVNEIMRRFRTFYNWAVKNRYTTNNPFSTYQVPSCVYGTPFFLTSEERDALFAFDFSSRPDLAVQRDIFVFQSNVGMRGGDLMELTPANIVNGAVEYVANKTVHETGRTIRVPLTEQAKTIIKRYKSDERVELLPFIEMHQYNCAIKDMLRLAKINRIVTVLNPTTREEEQHPIWEVASSHMGRRNFIGNLYNKTQDPNAIGSMTGHVDGSKAFARYRSIDDTVKKNLIAQL